MSKAKRILFVCLGNIVRSPLAENLFRHYQDHSNPGNGIEVDSAAVSAWHVGDPPDPRMVQTAAQHGVQVRGVSRQVTRQDFETFDLILAMDSQNLSDLLEMAPDPGYRRKIRLLREFDPSAEPGAEVPDPYYGGQSGFEQTFQIVLRAVHGLLKDLEEEM